MSCYWCVLTFVCVGVFLIYLFFFFACVSMHIYMYMCKERLVCVHTKVCVCVCACVRLCIMYLLREWKFREDVLGVKVVRGGGVNAGSEGCWKGKGNKWKKSFHGVGDEERGRQTYVNERRREKGKVEGERRRYYYSGLLYNHTYSQGTKSLNIAIPTVGILLVGTNFV